MWHPGRTADLTTGDGWYLDSYFAELEADASRAERYAHHWFEKRLVSSRAYRRLPDQVGCAGLSAAECAVHWNLRANTLIGRADKNETNFLGVSAQSSC